MQIAWILTSNYGFWINKRMKKILFFPLYDDFGTHLHGYLIWFAFLWSIECIISGQLSIPSYLEHTQSIESSSEYGLRMVIWGEELTWTAVHSQNLPPAPTSFFFSLIHIWLHRTSGRLSTRSCWFFFLLSDYTPFISRSSISLLIKTQMC